ncbi:MAG: glucuronate isomerase [Verrucomicrobia bacterium]|nr:glucuronate isomerase [Verrucomicrobiota bacterium]
MPLEGESDTKLPLFPGGSIGKSGRTSSQELQEFRRGKLVGGNNYRRRIDYYQVECFITWKRMNRDSHIPFTYSEPCDEAEASAIYARTRSGATPSDAEALKFRSFLLRCFGELDADSRWIRQLHLGALRNANRRRLAECGPDTGHDSIGDWPQAEPLGRYLDQLEMAGKLPKMILYNVNPSHNYVLATMIGNFQDGSIPGKFQFGSGWWFLDQKEGMEWQLNALASVGLLSRFVGMLTDSRSFTAAGNVTGGYTVLFVICAFAYLVAFVVNHLCAQIRGVVTSRVGETMIVFVNASVDFGSSYPILFRCPSRRNAIERVHENDRFPPRSDQHTYDY